MAIRRAPPNLLYSSTVSTSWPRALRSVIEEGLAALCVRQWQRVPVTIAQQGSATVARRRGRV